MKKILLLSVVLLSALTMMSQEQSIESRISYVDELPTAYYLHEYNLSVGDTTGTIALRNANNYPFERKEFEWAVRFATIYSDEAQKYDDECNYDFIRDGLDNFFRYNYQSAMFVNLQSLPTEYSDISSKEDYNNLRHNRWFRNAKFRKFAVGAAKRIMKEVVSFYPKDYKKYLLQQIDYAIDFMKDIPNHNYHVELESNEYGYSWLEMFDGEETSYQASQGIEGIILRRMLLNEIPLKELMDIAQDIRQSIIDTDVRENPDVMMCLRLNEDIGYCIGCAEPFFISYIPHEEFVKDAKRKVYTKYEPFELPLADKLKGWGCNYDIYITAVEHYNETTYFHEDGELKSQKNDLFVYDLLQPRYGFGHCFIENNIHKLEVDGMFRIHRKLY